MLLVTAFEGVPGTARFFPNADGGGVTLYSVLFVG